MNLYKAVLGTELVLGTIAAAAACIVFAMRDLAAGWVVFLIFFLVPQPVVMISLLFDWRKNKQRKSEENK